MPSDNSRPTACQGFMESRLAQITRLSQFMLKTGNCNDPSGHSGEVVNEVYIKLSESWERLRSPEDAIHKITANTARTHAHKCRRESPQELDERVIPCFTIGAQDPTAFYEQAILLKELLDQLRPEDQLIFSLLFQGLSFAQIEVLLEIPSSTIRSRYYRAIKNLRAAKLRLTDDLGPPAIVVITD